MDDEVLDVGLDPWHRLGEAEESHVLEEVMVEGDSQGEVVLEIHPHERWEEVMREGEAQATDDEYE